MSKKRVFKGEYRSDILRKVEEWLAAQLPEYTANGDVVIVEVSNVE